MIYDVDTHTRLCQWVRRPLHFLLQVMTRGVGLNGQSFQNVGSIYSLSIQRMSAVTSRAERFLSPSLIAICALRLRAGLEHESRPASRNGVPSDRRWSLYMASLVPAFFPRDQRALVDAMLFSHLLRIMPLARSFLGVKDLSSL